MKRIAYSKAAIKALRKMPANLSRRIRSKITQYAADPGSLGNNVIALKGEDNVIRLRIGDWRVIMTDDGDVLAVIRIAPRGEVYERR